MKISTAQSQKLKQYLPKTAVSTICKKIKKAVGERQIQKVLNGEAEDCHGIIEIALQLSNTEKSKANKTQKLLSQL